MNIFTVEGQEALRYAQGKSVELKDQPGKVYIIAEYEPMMIPPIWLENDPIPHYPHELNLLSRRDYRINSQTRNVNAA